VRFPFHSPLTLSKRQEVLWFSVPTTTVVIIVAATAWSFLRRIPSRMSILWYVPTDSTRSTSLDRPWPYRRAGLWALKEAPITRTLPRFRARSTRLYADWHVAGIMCFSRGKSVGSYAARICQRGSAHRLTATVPVRRYEAREGLSHRKTLPRCFPSILGHMRACRRESSALDSWAGYPSTLNRGPIERARMAERMKLARFLLRGYAQACTHAPTHACADTRARR